MRVSPLKLVAGAIVSVGLFGPAPAFAQYTKQVHCDGKKTLPVFDKLYIKKYCGPTICPGSCFGYFPTKWTQWEAACPPGMDCGGEAAHVVAGTPSLLLSPGTPVSPPAAAPAPTAVPSTPLPEKAPVPAPAAPVPAPAAPVPAKPVPLPLPGTTPEKPKTEALAVPPAPAPGVIELKVPEVNVQQPVLVKPLLQPPTFGKSS